MALSEGGGSSDVRVVHSIDHSDVVRLNELFALENLGELVKKRNVPLRRRDDIVGPGIEGVDFWKAIRPVTVSAEEFAAMECLKFKKTEPLECEMGYTVRIYDLVFPDRLDLSGKNMALSYNPRGELADYKFNFDPSRDMRSPERDLRAIVARIGSAARGKIKE